MTPVHVTAISGFHTLASVAVPVLAAAKKSSSSSGFTLIFFVLLFGVGYMFLIRPQRQRRQRQAQATKQIAVGDRVMLSSGIFGTVEGFVGDHARVEIAPGMVVEVLRQAVSQRVEEPVDGAVASDGPSYDKQGPSYDQQGPSYDQHSHEDLVDDAGHDPYSVAPLEIGDGKETTEDGDGKSGGTDGGGSR